MAGSSFGTLFRLTTFGESHGVAIGGVIDGFPSGIEVDLEYIQNQLNRRKPGQSSIVTQRKESDTVQFLSGIINGVSTGASIGFIIPNENQKSTDYSHLEDNFRPSHADFTYQEKYGIRDFRGGGRSSARETAVRVVAGALAQLALKKMKVSIVAFVDQVGTIKMPNNQRIWTQEEVDQSIVRCPDVEIALQMENYIKQIRKEGDTIGGAISCRIDGVPTGIGEPVFDKLHAVLGHALFSINAVKGVEFGSGFSGVEMLGSEHNDLFNPDFSTQTNYSGGIQGGISNGMPILFRVAFKPVATIMKDQKSVNIQGETVLLQGKGRHDPCVVPRAIPIVESMSAIVLLDLILQQNAYQFFVH